MNIINYHNVYDKIYDKIYDKNKIIYMIKYTI